MHGVRWGKGMHFKRHNGRRVPRRLAPMPLPDVHKPLEVLQTRQNENTMVVGAKRGAETRKHPSRRTGQLQHRPVVAVIPHVFVEKVSALRVDELVALLSPLAKTIFVITTGYDSTRGGVQTVPIQATKRASFLSKVIEQVSIHLQLLRILFTMRNEIDVLLFFLGGIEFAIPLAFAKCLNINCLVVLTGLGNVKRIQPLKERGGAQQYGELTRLRLATLLERLSFRFSDKLIVLDESLIDQANLRQYHDKIALAHRHFVDFSEFQMKDDIDERANVVSYVGRLHEEKGVLNLVKAIPKVVGQRDDVKFVIIGEGQLEGELRSYVAAHALSQNVTLAGWIPHEKLRDYLARSKLLVLPSYTEGLPHAMLEAMACGTPVLATPVGAVPEVIRDKETGFLVRDNSPDRLAESILSALAYPHLSRIAGNARALVEREFQYESVLKMWRNVICDA
jgi:glycosyltransferase involved in cell wall biosynthesis